MNILVPAAGLGSRFFDAGYTVSKPLVPVLGKPMIVRVMENLRPSGSHKFIIISRLDNSDIWPLITKDDVAIHLSKETDGAVDTLLKARAHMTTEPLMICNCDQLLSINVDDFIESAQYVDGSIATFHSNKNHHSYVTTSSITGFPLVTGIVEKEVVSNKAVSGVYIFRHGSDFLHYAEQVVQSDDRVRGEYYVSSVIARMIADGHSFVTYDAPTTALGTPEELQNFEVAVRVGKTL